MQITGMLKKVKVLPSPFDGIVYATQFTGFIRKTSAFCKTNTQMQLISQRFVVNKVYLFNFPR